MAKQLAWAAAAGLFFWSSAAGAQSEAAKRFGARENVQQISLSPDGTRLLYLVPGQGAATLLLVAEPGKVPVQIAASTGSPDRLRACHWATNERVVCTIYMVTKQDNEVLWFERSLAMNADGQKPSFLNMDTSSRALGTVLGGERIIDWVGASGNSADGSVLMTRIYVPERTINTRLANESSGLGVDRVDVNGRGRKREESPHAQAIGYITDGLGHVRIMLSSPPGSQGYASNIVRTAYRPAGGGGWKDLATYNLSDNSGFYPLAVDPKLDVVYGLEKNNGRQALYRIALDGSARKTLVATGEGVDVDDVVTVGREQRVVGVTYATDRRKVDFFDPAYAQLGQALSKALPQLPLIRFVDASADETKLLLWAGSDVDPGRYYLFDRNSKQLTEVLLSRPELEKQPLAPVKPVTYAAADGTMIPAYLTLPPGSSGRGLPAIVMPHGGPGARDEWGFDWLAQFFAARGYAVLQPNFRGSAGYGEKWFNENGFRNWRTAIGDVDDGARWLVSQGVADSNKLGILGWSYGGYAALQGAVVDPALYKAVVAIAPVTDLGAIKQEALNWSDYRLVKDFVGGGPHIESGSPARNASHIAAPVLLLHGDLDRNVSVQESKLMRDRLASAGKTVKLVTFPGLDHYLESSPARSEMLDQADGWFRTAFGM